MSILQNDTELLEQRIFELQKELRDAEETLQHRSDARQNSSKPGAITTQHHARTTSLSSLHTLLLLADSALPLGSFAFSAGLESYLAHHRSANASAPQQLGLLHTFLPQSLLTLASTSLPYVLAAWREPHRLVELDDAFDASVVCTVARRASTSQGRALLGVWERSFRHATATTEALEDEGEGVARGRAMDELRSFGRTFKLQPMTATSLTASPFECGYVLHAHLGPLWGVVTRALDVDDRSAAYLYLFTHARTVISAGVRAGVLGPYQAQSELANANLTQVIEQLIVQWWDTAPEDSAQVVPIMDMWVGRHEKLYSRIFNS